MLSGWGVGDVGGVGIGWWWWWWSVVGGGWWLMAGGMSLNLYTIRAGNKFTRACNVHVWTLAVATPCKVWR